MVHIRHGASCA